MLTAAVTALLVLAPGIQTAAPPAGPVTFTRDIAPVLFRHCAPCHRPGESAPFSLLSYEDAGYRAPMIARVTSTRYMPPWLPRAAHGTFRDERRLSEDHVAAIQRWAEQGAPEGDAKDLPPAPQFTPGWQLGEPDLVVNMSRPYRLAAEGADVIRNFVLPLPTRSPRYIRAWELRPGNPRIVHHAVMQLDRTGSCRALESGDGEPGFAGMEPCAMESPEGHILSWTPGQVPSLGREGMAWRLEPGSDLILQLHLLPSGRAEPIQASVGFYFSEQPPALEPYVVVLRNNHIDIPAGARDYQVGDEFRLPVDVRLLSLYPHAHYLGKEMKITAQPPDGKERMLLWIPDWDFSWQDVYRFTRPVELAAGTLVRMRYSYDNSAENIRNPSHPPRRVVHGGRSTDEMANLMLQVLPASAAELPHLVEAAWRHIARDPSNPRAGAAHANLGFRLAERGEVKEAIRHYRRALDLLPEDFRTRNNLGLALQREGELGKALEQFQRAVELAPANTEILNNLGVAHALRQDNEQALRYFRRAVAADPQNAEAHNNLGNALGSAWEEAIAHYREAVRIRPEYAEAHNNLGIALTRLGRLQEAVGHFRQALRLRPDYAEARRNLEMVTSLLPAIPGRSP